MQPVLGSKRVHLNIAHGARGMQLWQSSQSRRLQAQVRATAPGAFLERRYLKRTFIDRSCGSSRCLDVKRSSRMKVKLWHVLLQSFLAMLRLRPSAWQSRANDDSHFIYSAEMLRNILSRRMSFVLDEHEDQWVAFDVRRGIIDGGVPEELPGHGKIVDSASPEEYKKRLNLSDQAVQDDHASTADDSTGARACLLSS